MQPFDFGLDNPTGLKNDSTEQRLNTLEVKLVDLEFAIAKLQQGPGSGTAITGDPSPLHSQPSHHTVDEATSSRSLASPEPTFLSSPRPSSSFSEESEDQEPPLEHRIHRSSATTTLRPNTAIRRSVEQGQVPPTPSKLNYATMDHIENLLALVQREQASRHRLELQVQTLSTQLEQFQRSPPYSHFEVTSAPEAGTTTAVAAAAAAAEDLYPTPSPEHSSVKFGQQASGRGSTGSGHVVKGPPPPLAHSSQHSSFRDDISSSTEDEEEDDDNEKYTDVYQTPTEDREHKFSLESLRSPQMVGMI